MSFTKGFKDTRNVQTYTYQPKNHWVIKGENVEVMFLESEPTIIYFHSYFDPRLINPKDNSLGLWTKAICLEHNEGIDKTIYPSCPRCKIERLRGKGIQSNLNAKAVMTVFSFNKYLQKSTKEEKVSGRSLFMMSQKTAEAIENMVELQKKKNPDFTLEGAVVNCFRSKADKSDAVGDAFTYIETKDPQDVLAEYPGHEIEPFEYESIFTSLPLNVIEQELKEIFPLKAKTPVVPQKQVRKTIPPKRELPKQNAPEIPDFPYDESDGSSDEIPF